MILPAVFALASFFFAWLGAALLRHWASRLGLIDIPNERSSHTVPTPRGGGLAIVIVVLIGLPALALYRGVFSAGIVLTYLIAGAIIAAVGWIDDRRSLSARLRLTPQIAVAVITIIGMGFVADVRPPLVPPVLTGGIAGIVHWGWLGLPLTLVWIVGLINAYNFMGESTAKNTRFTAKARRAQRIRPCFSSRSWRLRGSNGLFSGEP